MGRWSILRKERRERGLCPEAGCDEVTGDKAYRCAKHKAEHNAVDKLRYWARKARREAKAA